MEKRCKNCKHWLQDQTIYVRGDDTRITSVVHPYGTCHRIKMIDDNLHFEPDPENVLDEEPAFVEDGSDFHAALRPGPEFGCVLFESKE